MVALSLACLLCLIGNLSLVLGGSVFVKLRYVITLCIFWSVTVFVKL